MPLSVALLCGACSAPAPAPTPTSTTAATSQRAVALSTLQPCDLLPEGRADSLGYSAPAPIALGGTRACRWSGQATGESMTITFGTGRVAELEPKPADTTTTHTVGVHRGARIKAADAARCTLVFDIDTRDLVLIQAVVSSTAEAACQDVMTVAELVEPVLP